MLVPREVLEQRRALRRRALRLLARTPTGRSAPARRVPPLRRPGEPRPAQGLGLVGRRELADRALLRHAQRARRSPSGTRRSGRSGRGGGGWCCSSAHAAQALRVAADGGRRSRLCATAGATSGKGRFGPRMCPVTAQQAKQVVKNALYRTIGETSTALRLQPDAQKTLSILMYHKVNDLPDNPTTVPVARLRRAARAARRARLQRRRPRRRPRPLHGRARRCPRRRC